MRCQPEQSYKLSPARCIDSLNGVQTMGAPACEGKLPQTNLTSSRRTHIGRAAAGFGILSGFYESLASPTDTKPGTTWSRPVLCRSGNMVGMRPMLAMAALAALLPAVTAQTGLGLGGLSPASAPGPSAAIATNIAVPTDLCEREFCLQAAPAACGGNCILTPLANATSVSGPILDASLQKITATTLGRNRFGGQQRSSWDVSGADGCTPAPRAALAAARIAAWPAAVSLEATRLADVQVAPAASGAAWPRDHAP